MKLKTIDKKDLREIIQSGHINFLIGSGCSSGYLPMLGDIEKRMNDPATEEDSKKQYLAIINKSKAILDENRETDQSEKANLLKTKKAYGDFLNFWLETLSRRALPIVNKQINVFTTNFDMFIEDACESSSIPYNDGFSGQIKPEFDPANFNRIQKYKTLQFDNISDFPLFNIVKLHGSLSWEATTDKTIVYSQGDHIKDNLGTLSGSAFLDEYKSQVAVINPNAEKHYETVLDIRHAALLRKFTLELEKENSILFVFGTSLGDGHIKHLLDTVMRTNPTLIVLYFSFSPYQTDRLGEKKYPNLYVVYPDLKIESFDAVFGSESRHQWESFVVDPNAEKIEPVDEIKTRLHEISEDTDEGIELKIN